jgi:hypothetical protein
MPGGEAAEDEHAHDGFHGGLEAGAGVEAEIDVPNVVVHVFRELVGSTAAAFSAAFLDLLLVFGAMERAKFAAGGAVGAAGFALFVGGCAGFFILTC